MEIIETYSLGMINLEATVKRIPMRYGSNRIAYLVGKILIMQYYYDGMVAKGDKKVWACISSYRSNKYTHFETENEANEYCKSQVQKYVEDLQFSHKE